jgi:RHS repeat-associated protein
MELILQHPEFATATFYVRDASGNVMAVYKTSGTTNLTLEEQHIYGSSRLGIFKKDKTIKNKARALGERRYELTDHLGNVRVVMSDYKRTAVIVLSATDYYPFGMVARTYTSPEEYRYGFNGKEKEDDISSGDYDFGARMYDPRSIRFLSVDPLAHVQPDKTPYHFVSNNPINRIDPTGMLDEWVEKDGQMMYDNRVINQEDATALYGEGATYRPNGYTYTSSSGANIELGDYGFFKSNGQINSSPDLAQNSLAYTNPSQAMANAQSQIAGVRGNYTASAGVVGFISADVAIPELTDAAWPKWAAYAVAGGIAAYYVAKMEAEIEGIMRRAGGPQGFQYSLRATTTGAYTCYTCGSGSMNLSLGDVWKYGETTQGTGRYSQNFLNTNRVQLFPEFYGNQVQIKVMEKNKIYGYFLQNGHLPPGNKIFR